MTKDAIVGLLHDAMTFASGLLPGALGATVSIMVDNALTWTQRFTQLAVGIIISYFSASALHSLHPFDPFVEQGISFTVGMIGYKAVPKFISSSAETAGSIPKDLWAWARSKLPGFKA